MSDDVNGTTGQSDFTPPVAAAPEYELVGRGLFFAVGAVLAGFVLTIVIWRLGFIASITSFVLAAGAVRLYVYGATAAPRKGLIPLILLIVVGVVACFFGIVANDAWDAYDQLPVDDTRVSFILDNIFRGEVLKEYGKDMAMFGVFAALGVFSTLRGVLAKS